MINADFFGHNRAELGKLVEDGSAIVLAGYDSMQLTADMSVPFRQEANFWYLTGIEEPGWRLIWADGKSWLVAPEVSPTRRVFEGGLSADQAQQLSGVDAVISAQDAKDLLSKFAQSKRPVYSLGKDRHSDNYGFWLNPAPEALWRELGDLFHDQRDIRSNLARLRAIKQPAEIEAVRRAVNLTKEAFELARQRLPEISSEYELEAVFTSHLRSKNAHHAYDPIVAGGMQACTLHYSQNSANLEPASLVLIDIGARQHGYSADITRTYAVGEPTQRQQAVHQALRQAHLEIIDLLRPGLSFQDYHQQVDRRMYQALDSLGLIKSDSDYRRYFPHAISHGLGVDVHDSLGGHEAFEPGMVLTVEPGIYIPEESIGARLEDNILITEQGHENLSQSLSLDM